MPPKHKQPYTDQQKVLEQDLNTVLGVQESEKRGAILGSTLFYESTPEDVEEWYYGEDPLDEVTAYRVDQLPHDRRLNWMVQREMIQAVGLEKGGSLLAASYAFPEVFADPELSKDWRGTIDAMFDAHHSHNNIPMQNEGTLVTADDIAWFSLETTQDKELDLEDVRRLSLSAEMFMGASIIRNRWQQLIDIDGYLKQHFDIDMNTHSAAVADLMMAHLIRERIISKVLAPEHVVADERTKIALKAQWQDTLSIFSSQDSRTKGMKHPQTQQAMAAMIDSLDKAFLDTDALTDPDKRAEWKGLLHELVWMLDSYMIIFSDKKYADISLYLANSRDDAPKVGRPQLRRGFDLAIGTNGRHSRVQLKSGNGTSATEYHPGIKVLREENFNDFNARRLAAKLAKYREVVVTGFSQDPKPVIEKYALKTAVAEVEVQQEKQREKQAAKLVVDTNLGRVTSNTSGNMPFMNRETRRRYEKELRKR